MDPIVAAQLSAQLVSSAADRTGLITVTNNNLIQSVAAMLATAVQAGAAAAQYGSDRTAIHVPATDAATNAAKV